MTAVLTRPLRRVPLLPRLDPRWCQSGAYVSAGQLRYNLVNRRADTVGGVLIPCATPMGLALDPGTASGNNIAATAPESSSWTIVAGVWTTALAGTEQLIAADDAGANRFFQFRTESGGTLRLILFSTDGSNVQTTLSSVPANSFVVMAARADGLTGTVAVNGRVGLPSTGSGAAKTWASSFAGTWFDRSGTEHGAHKSLFRVIIPRALSDTELVSVTLNPWQFLDADEIVIPSAAAGASAPTIGDLRAVNVGANSTQWSLDYTF